MIQSSQREIGKIGKKIRKNRDKSGLLLNLYSKLAAGAPRSVRAAGEAQEVIMSCRVFRDDQNDYFIADMTIEKR